MGTIAMYLRLSSEDEDTDFHGRKHESDSIVNQRALIRDYILGITELEDYNIVEFVDDGLSGTNMERPGFQAMIKEAEKGLINVVVVKDLSRIGRNYIEVGDILEQEFPSLDIRVIAINDNFDSNDYDGTTAGLAVVIKMMTYDLYSKQLSAKVKQVQYAMMEQGKYVNTSPYGYKVLPDNRHQLVIDDEAAGIVRMIFRMAAKGISTSDIALSLNKRNVATPFNYKNIKKKSERYQGSPCWTHSLIVDILRNDKYVGSMVYHKRQKRRVTDRRDVRNDKSKWLYVPKTHEAIVSEEEFAQANEALRKVAKFKKTPTKKTNLFFCPYCEYRLRKTYGTDTYFSCSHKAYTGNDDCKRVYWSKSDAEAVLIKLFRLNLSLNLEDEVQNDVSETNYQAIKSKKVRMNFLGKTIAGFNRNKADLYERYRAGEISREAFITLKSTNADDEIAVRKEYDEVEAEIAAMEDIAQQLKLEKLINKKKATIHQLPDDRIKDIMYCFISKVYLYDNNRMKVIWNVHDNKAWFEIMP